MVAGRGDEQYINIKTARAAAQQSLMDNYVWHTQDLSSLKTMRMCCANFFDEVCSLQAQKAMFNGVEISELRCKLTIEKRSTGKIAVVVFMFIYDPL